MASSRQIMRRGDVVDSLPGPVDHGVYLVLGDDEGRRERDRVGIGQSATDHSEFPHSRHDGTGEAADRVERGERGGAGGEFDGAEQAIAADLGDQGVLGEGASKLGTVRACLPGRSHRRRRGRLVAPTPASGGRGTWSC